MARCADEPNLLRMLKTKADGEESWKDRFKVVSGQQNIKSTVTLEDPIFTYTDAIWTSGNKTRKNSWDDGRQLRENTAAVARQRRVWKLNTSVNGLD